MKNATQDELACYIANTGCDFEFFHPDFKFSVKVCIPAEWGPRDYVSAGYHIYPILSFGLPSHLEPRNPAGLSAEQITEGGKYRAWSLAEQERALKGFGAAVDDLQMWLDGKWHANSFSGTHPNRTYRLPADTPFPDWSEMSKAKIESEIPPPPINRCPSTFPHPGHDYCPGVPFSKAVVKESLTAQASTEESSGVQPAPGETPETDALLNDPDRKSDNPLWTHARTLERQRDQAREEIAALQEQCQHEGKAGAEVMRVEQLQSEVQVLREQRDEANADRVRLREVIQERVDAIKEYRSDPGITCLRAGKADDALEQALSTPAPEMVSKEEIEETKAALEQLYIYHEDKISNKEAEYKKAIEMTEKVLRGERVEMIAKAEHDAIVKELNDRLQDRTSGMLDGQVRIQGWKHAPSFRDGWEAGMNRYDTPGAPDKEQALREWMDEPDYMQDSAFQEEDPGEIPLLWLDGPSEKEASFSDTFEAHGKTWARHDGSGECPGNPDRFIDILEDDEINTADEIMIGRYWHWHPGIIGWRYAD